MPHLATAACSLHYQIDGPEGGPVLLLSNSLGCTLGMWDGQVAALARRYRVIRYDSRGHGESGVPPGPYTVDALAADALALLDGMGIERAHFCGLSLGGMVGMWLGAHAGHRLGSVVLANTSAKLGPPEMWEGRITTVRSQGTGAIAETVLQRWFTPSFRSSSPAAVERCRRMLLETPPEGYMGCCAAIRDMDQINTLAAIKNRTLVIVGEHDPSTPPAQGRLIAERIAGANIVSFPAAHLSNIEAAPAFNDALLEFLRDP